MANLIIPTIGESGYYTLKPPFDASMIPNTVYTCQGIRRIGEYLAYNEDVFTDVYVKNGLTEADFQKDQASNMYIVSLQSETGQWIYVPASYIESYPIMNGVKYQNFMLGVSLGALPVNLDLTAIQGLVSNVIYQNLGITPKIVLTALSKPVLVDTAQHETIQNARLVRATQKLTDYGRWQQTVTQLQQAVEQIQQLEAFIKKNYLANVTVVPPSGP